MIDHSPSLVLLAWAVPHLPFALPQAALKNLRGDWPTTIIAHSRSAVVALLALPILLASTDPPLLLDHVVAFRCVSGVLFLCVRLRYLFLFDERASEHVYSRSLYFAPRALFWLHSALPCHPVLCSAGLPLCCCCAHVVRTHTLRSTHTHAHTHTRPHSSPCQ